ncbi:MAG: polysaccharide deacetylase family protein [Elusimicrobia bacterium]|nr:polysaccharide deacetylase family protein [Elusimicrobiota bacterium]
MLNAITIDVEEWFDTILFNGRPAGACSRLPENIAAILALLERHCVKATFFILGSVAKNHPAAVKAIAAAGHEIASHGATHRAVCRLTAEEFLESLRASADALAALTGTRPAGYRAPTFSVLQDEAAFLAALKTAGYAYDSSLYPVLLSGRPRAPYTAACGLREFPPSVFSCAGLGLPFLGGSFLRLLPAGFVAARLAELNAAGTPGMLYFHSWEFETARPEGAGPVAAAGQFLNAGSVPRKVAALLDSFEFAPARQVLAL